MNSHIVERLVIELSLKMDEFQKQVKESEGQIKDLKETVGELSDSQDKSAKTTEKLDKNSNKLNKNLGKMNKSVMDTVKSVRNLIAAFATPVVIERFTTGIAKINDQLYFLQQRLDLGSRKVTLMGNALAALGGGDARAVHSYMQDLNQSMMQLIIAGDASILPFFNALGVGIADASGNAREMDDVLIDMARSLSQMDKREAYALTSMMGMPDEIANALIQGEEAVRELLEMQKKLHTSTDEELKASRELIKQQKILRGHWEGLKLMLGNALVPLMTKLVKYARDFVEYLAQHKDIVTTVFKGLAFVVGVVTVGAFAKLIGTVFGLFKAFRPLLSVLKKAAGLFRLLFTPIGAVVAIITAAAAAIALLVDDYKVWARGGESLFDWTAFSNTIDTAKKAFDALGDGIKAAWQYMGDLIDKSKEWLTQKGFFNDDGSFTFKSFRKGISNLIDDLEKAVPLLKTARQMMTAVRKLLTGDVKGAWASLEDASEGVIDTGKILGTSVINTVNWVSDKMPEFSGNGFIGDLFSFGLGGGTPNVNPINQNLVSPYAINQGRSFTNKSTATYNTRTNTVTGGGVDNDYHIHIGGITVNSNATNLSGVSKDAVRGAFGNGFMLDQIGGGL